MCKVKIDWDLIHKIQESPHILGWLIGKEASNPLHSEWIKYIWDTPNGEKRALQSFRGSYKSTNIDVVGAVRWMLFFPDDRIAIVRKSITDASTIVASIRQAMELPLVRELFRVRYGICPEPVVSRTEKLQYNFKQTITPEPNIMAFGITSSLTGYHFDKILCDDIITLRDRISRAEREHTREAVRELAANIIDPGKSIMFIGTPWHKDDAWSDINAMCQIAKYPISQYNFLGDNAIEEKKKATTPFLFAANYELELRKDDSRLFDEPTYIDKWDFGRKSMAHLDAAYGGGDTCALTILSPLDRDGFREAGSFQCVGFSYAGHVDNWLSKIAEYYKKYKCVGIYCETNADKGYLAEKLRGFGMTAYKYHETQNKDIKISTNLYAYWKRLLWVKETDDEYLNMIMDWREGTNDHDDPPDSCASLIRNVCRRRGIQV